MGGYLAAGIGGAMGAMLLTKLGLFLGIKLASLWGMYGLEGIVPPVIGAVAGCWVGEVLGCWLCLFIGRYSDSGQTSALVIVLMSFGIGLWFWLASLGHLGRVSHQKFNLLVSGLLFGIPLLARFWANSYWF